MHPDSGFQRRLSAQSLRFVQRHPRVEHLEVVVITPHHRLKLGPSNPPRLLQAVLEEVHWISLEKMSQQPDLDPLLNLGLPRFRGHVDRRNAMTTRLSIDDQPKPCSQAVHAAAEGRGCCPLPG